MVVLAGVPFWPLPITVGMRIALMLFLGMSVAAMEWLRRLLRRDRPITGAEIYPPWAILALSFNGIIAVFGVFSAAASLLVVVISYMTIRGDATTAPKVYGLCVGVHGVLALSVALGAMPDPGMIPASQFTHAGMLVAELAIQLIFALTYRFAKATRQTFVDTMAELARAVRDSAYREALFSEAREELERALLLGGEGRLTDQEVGAYRLGRLIGRGAMGEVYEATDIYSHDLVAVKVLQTDEFRFPERMALFRREADVLASVNSPHVVRIVGVGDETSPLPHFAMERLQGHDLSYHLRVRTRLPPVEVIDMLRQLCAGVHAAHQAGIVHRDLKPQNVVLHETPGARSIWKVLDFGVSYLIGDHKTFRPGQVVGTPGFMAPEQVLGLDVDPRTDVHALAVIAFRALTGTKPYGGVDRHQLMYNIVHAPVPSIGQYVPGLPGRLGAVLKTAMAKEPGCRFASAEMLANELSSVLDIDAGFAPAPEAALNWTAHASR